LFLYITKYCTHFYMTLGVLYYFRQDDIIMEFHTVRERCFIIARPACS